MFWESLCYWFVEAFSRRSWGFEGDRMWFLCEMRCVCSSQWKTGEYASSLMCWNSSQVWSEGFGNRWVGGGDGDVSLNWNDRLVEASLTQETQPWIWTECVWLFQKAQLFIHSPLANFSGVKKPPVLWCIILFTLFGACVEEIQLRCKGTLQFSFSSQSVSLLF